MAESFDKEKNPVFNDDMIKDALKTELLSIQASDGLVRTTLALCKKEIELLDQRHLKRPIWPGLLKLGTPLVAGALVLVLVFSGPQMKKASERAAAPQASEISGNSIASTARNSNMLKDEVTEASPPAPIPSASTEAGGQQAKGMVGDMVFSESIDGLFSSANRTENEYKKLESTEQIENFEAIVTQYNTVQGTNFTLYKTGVTRVETLVDTGVTAQMLKDMTDYHELLSGKGYWLLPLQNANGMVEDLVTVNSMDNQNKKLTISSNDFVFTTNNHSFLVSPHPSGALIAKACELMFEPSSINNMVKAEGYKNISDITVVDINYGIDFLVMLKGDNKELGIPFVVDPALYGFENKRVYLRDELTKIITETMLK